MAESPTNTAPAAWLLRRRSADPVEIWGLTPEERLRRTLRALGCTPIESVEAGEAPPPAGAASVLLLRSDYIYDERLVRALPDAPGTSTPATRTATSATARSKPGNASMTSVARLRPSTSECRQP